MSRTLTLCDVSSLGKHTLRLKFSAGCTDLKRRRSLPQPRIALAHLWSARVTQVGYDYETASPVMLRMRSGPGNRGTGETL
jgi:hypothetical protein